MRMLTRMLMLMPTRTRMLTLKPMMMLPAATLMRRLMLVRTPTRTRMLMTAVMLMLRLCPC